MCVCVRHRVALQLLDQNATLQCIVPDRCSWCLLGAGKLRMVLQQQLDDVFAPEGEGTQLPQSPLRLGGTQQPFDGDQEVHTWTS